MLPQTLAFTVRKLLHIYKKPRTATNQNTLLFTEVFKLVCEPCGPGVDRGVVGVRDAEEDNDAYYCIYLVAQGILIQEELHQEVAVLVT